MEPEIRIEGLSKVYAIGWSRSGPKAINSLSFEVQKGQIVGVLGGNGSGKSTLLKSICGLLPISTGSILISGSDPATAVHQKKLGYLPERPSFPGYQTPRNFLMYLGRLSGVDGGSLKGRVQTCIEECGMQKVADTRIGQLSKGGIQRLAMAQALLHDPEVLLMDEPMDGLDPLARDNTTAHIRRLSDAGKTVVFATHLLEGLESVCDQLLVLHRGRSIFFGPPQFESGIKTWLLDRLREGEEEDD
jgi:ABC-2 type transport system ATP-binding protein